MPRDFSAKHIRVSQLIASGGITGQSKLGLAIYSASAASSLVGGMNSHLTTRLSNVGQDTFFYVDGTPNYRQSGSLDAGNPGSTVGVTVFGGDVVISGTLYSERQIVEIEQTRSGSFTLDGVLGVTGSAVFLSTVLIDQNETGNHKALEIDSESTDAAALHSHGKYAAYFEQDIADGYAGWFTRNIAEAGSNPLVTIHDDHTSNTQTTLKIRQDGTGDILNLFDGATEVMTVLDGGRVGIGATAPLGKLHLETDDATTCLFFERHDSSIGDGDELGCLAFGGTLDGSTYNSNSVVIRVLAEGAWSDIAADTGAKLQFMTTADGSSSPLTAMTLTGDRDVGIGTTAPGAKLEVQVADADNVGGLLIDFNETGAYKALEIDSESTSEAALESKGKYAGYFLQDITNGYAGYFTRNIAEAGQNPLVTIKDDNTSNTQTALYIKQDGAADSLNVDSIFALKGRSTTASGNGLMVLTGSINVQGSSAGYLLFDVAGSSNKVTIKGNPAGASSAVAFEVSGSLGRIMQARAGGVIFNQDGGDQDFRIASDDNSYAFFVDGGNDTVFIGRSSDPSGKIGDLNVFNSSNTTLVVDKMNGTTGSIFFTTQDRVDAELTLDTSENFLIQNNLTDADITIKVNDGGSSKAIGFFDASRMAVAFGEGASISSDNTSVGGGLNNNIGANAAAATIGGGSYNIVSATSGTIAGGSSNKVAGNGDEGTIGGGSGHLITRRNATIAGGLSGSISGEMGTIGGGASNTVSSYAGVIAGGLSGTISGQYGTIAGGASNTVSSYAGAVLGGTGSNVSGQGSVGIGTGLQVPVANIIAIGGGTLAGAKHTYQTVLSSTLKLPDIGASSNTDFLVIDANGVVTRNNSINPDTGIPSASYAENQGSGVWISPVANNNKSVAIGQHAQALGHYSFAAGGRSNEIVAGGTYSVIAGGYDNTAGSALVAILGGSGSYAQMPGTFHIGCGITSSLANSVILGGGIGHERYNIVLSGAYTKFVNEGGHGTHLELAYDPWDGGHGNQDVKISFTKSGVAKWAMGFDDSNSDKFKLVSGSDLGTASVMEVGSTAVVFNQNNANLDFRVEGSSASTNLFKCDAGLDIVSITGPVGDDTAVFRVSGNNDSNSGTATLFEVDPDAILVNQSNQDVNFVVSTANKNNMFFVDAALDMIGIGHDSPDVMLHLSTGSVGAPSIKIENTNADGNGGKLEFVKWSGSQADDDELGKIAFYGKDSGGTQTAYAYLEAKSSDVTNGDEGGQLNFYVFAGGTGGSSAARRLLQIGGEDVVGGDLPKVWINDAGINCDFQVSGENATKMIWMDGSNDIVHIQGSTGDDTDLFRISGNDDSGSSIGSLLEVGPTEVCINEDSNDVDFRVESATGTHAIYVNAGAPEVVINEDSIDMDFRVESNGAQNMFFVDGGQNRIGINTGSPDETIHVESANSAEPVFKMENTNADANGPILLFNKSATASPADGDQIGLLKFTGVDDAGNATIYAKIEGKTYDVTNGLEKGQISFSVPTYQNNMTEALTIRGYASSGQVNVGILNSTPTYPLDVTGVARFSTDVRIGGDIKDSGGNNCIEFDGSGNIDGLADITCAINLTDNDLTVRDDNGHPIITIESNSNSAYTPQLKFERSDGSNASKTATDAGEVLGYIRWYGYNTTTSAGYDEAARITAYVDGTPGGDSSDMPGGLIFSVTPDGTSTPVEAVRISNVGDADHTPHMAVTGSLTIGTGFDHSDLHRKLNIKQTVNGAAIVLEYYTGTNDWSFGFDAVEDSEYNVLNYYYNGASKGYIQSDTDVSELTFTGQHWSRPANGSASDWSDSSGLIVVSVGTYNSMIASGSASQKDHITITESIPQFVLSSARNQKSAYGVVAAIEDDSDKRREKFGVFVTNKTKEPDDARVYVNSIGEGAIWVSNINGNLENGDYITTCEIPGYGMKQDDDLLHNYTVSKITMDCEFDLNSSDYKCEEFTYDGSTYKKAFVGCTYHCG